MSAVLNDYSDDPGILALATRLRDSDSTVRRIALRNLADIADEEHAPLFIGALGDPAAEVRFEAAKALEAWETPAIVAGLVGRLSDLDADVREVAAQTLAELKLPASSAALLPHV